mgnify:CR=1 FL=1
MTSTSSPIVHDLVRIDVLVRPVHLGYVHEAFDALLDLHEAAVVGDVRDLAEQARARRIATRDVAAHGSAPSCLRPSDTRWRSRSNLSTLTSSSWPTADDFRRMLARASTPCR